MRGRKSAMGMDTGMMYDEEYFSDYLRSLSAPKRPA